MSNEKKEKKLQSRPSAIIKLNNKFPFKKKIYIQTFLFSLLLLPLFFFPNRFVSSFFFNEIHHFYNNESKMIMMMISMRIKYIVLFCDLYTISFSVVLVSKLFFSFVCLNCSPIFFFKKMKNRIHILKILFLSPSLY